MSEWVCVRTRQDDSVRIWAFCNSFRVERSPRSSWADWRADVHLNATVEASLSQLSKWNILQTIHYLHHGTARPYGTVNISFKLQLACSKHTLVQLWAASRMILLLLPVFVLRFLWRNAVSGVCRPPRSPTRWSWLMTAFVYCAFQEAMRTNIPVDVPDGAHLACDERFCSHIGRRKEKKVIRIKIQRKCMSSFSISSCCCSAFKDCLHQFIIFRKLQQHTHFNCYRKVTVCYVTMMSKSISHIFQLKAMILPQTLEERG